MVHLYADFFQLTLIFQGSTLQLGIRIMWRATVGIPGLSTAWEVGAPNYHITFFKGQLYM